MTANSEFDVIVIGAGVGGIYQIKRLTDLGFNAILLEGAPDLGGTWYQNRYPGCRFDSESYTYGYSFSKELLNEWHWSERFSGQPENLTIPELCRRQIRSAEVHALQLPRSARCLRRRQRDLALRDRGRPRTDVQVPGHGAWAAIGAHASQI